MSFFAIENSREPGIFTTTTTTPQLTISTGGVLVLQHPPGFQRLVMLLGIEYKHRLRCISYDFASL